LTDGSHITGSTAQTLVISPVGAGDAATTAQGYYCIVTSGCNVSANTTTNSLTVGSPAILVWQGGNPNTNWDLSTTPNFTNSVGTAVVFHNGDNVTFNDSSAVLALSINNNFIAPSLITDGSSQAYTFNGPGVIQGPGALQLNGPGNLIINNSNAYSGGTTISGGSLVLSNGSFFAVGTGPITLAGGTLDIPIKGNSAVGLSNNINVTADSTLQFDQNATFACVLNGAITGNSGKTLTINADNPNSGTARLRMYAPFTNNANVVLTSSTGQAEIEMAPYLSSGNQAFNGIISGTAGHFVPRGNGNVIFNNTNTFNDATLASTPTLVSVLMSSGNVGIGADSVSTTPPTIDASPVGVGKVAINVGTEGGTCSFFASGGAHTIANQFIYTSTTNTVTVVFSGSNALTLSGEFDLANSAGDPSTNRTLQVTNTAATTFAGVVSDNGANCGLIKIGNGTLYLNGTNTYTGPTTNNAGVLAGSGSIAGPVFVNTNGSIGGGSAGSIGTLTINSNLTLNGNVFVRVNESLSPAQSNDTVSVTGTLANVGTGTVTVTNVGLTPVSVGDVFKIFSGQVTGGSALTVTGAGMNWTNKLGIDGTIAALSAASTVATNPTNISFSFSGNTLSLTWPGDHLGWTLLTNSSGLTSNNSWFAYPNSASVTNVNVIVSPNSPRVFFRLNFVVP
jgi:autotransporter-associated beta strand protein